MSDRVLAVCYGGSHAATLAPVVAALRSQGVPVTALALTTARLTFQRLGVACEGYEDYIDPVRDHDAIELGVELLGDVNGEAVGVPNSESIAYLGANFRDLCEIHGEPAARRLYEERGRHAFLPLRTMARIIDQVDPGLVIATNSPKSEMAALRLARERGIPTLEVPDMNCDPRWELALPFPAEYYAVMSKLGRHNLLVHHGAREDAIRITGQPAFDKSKVPAEAECLRAVQDVIGSPVTGPFLLLLSSTYGGRSSLESDAVEAIRETLPITLRDSWPAAMGIRALLHALPEGIPAVIKPHPSEGVDGYMELAGGRPQVFVLPGSFDVNLAIRAARWVAAGTTTTALVDALCLDRPTIAVDLAARTDNEQYTQFDADDIVPIARSADEVATMLRELLAGTGMLRAQEGPRAAIAAVNASATANVARFARELLSAPH